jgi:hypothetical protein
MQLDHFHLTDATTIRRLKHKGQRPKAKDLCDDFGTIRFGSREITMHPGYA